MEILTTFLLEAESIVNSRPLTYVSCNEDNIEANAPSALTVEDVCGRKQWKIAQIIAEDFWKELSNLYIASPQKGPHLSVEDVSIPDPIIPSKWKMPE